MNEKKWYIAAEISQKEGGGGGRRKRKEAPEEEEELETHLLRRGVFSPWDVGPIDYVFLAPIWSSRLLSNKPLPHQSPPFGPTLYKFIVIGSLGLDPVCRLAQSENQDPTVYNIHI